MIGRVNAGGGGSLQATDAILRVIAPAGSTVTISKGGVSKSDAGHENAADNTLYDYYFIIHQSQFDSINPWTVTATLGSDTKSDTVIIDAADEYDVILSYDLYFVRNGIVQDGFTATLSGISSASITQGDGYLEHDVPQVNSSFTALYYGVKQNFPIGYNYLVYDGQQKGFYQSPGTCPAFGLISTLATGSSNSTFIAYTGTRNARDNNYIARDVYTLDISNVSGDYWVGSSIASSANQSVTGGERVFNLYLTNNLPE